MAAGAVYYDADGNERFQPAEVVILACNGIGTPRLLLNSASARFPDGLANSSGLVGKNLMLHPWPIVAGYVEAALDGGRGPITCLWSKQFYETDPARGFVRGYTLQFGRNTGPANQALGIEGSYDYSFVENTGHLLQIEKPDECIRLTLEFLGKHGLA